MVENHSVFAPRIKQHLLQAAPAEFAISPLVKAEVFSDALSPDYAEAVKHAKDIAAGAVLICAVGAVLIGGVTFWAYFQM